VGLLEELERLGRFRGRGVRLYQISIIAIRR